MSIKRSAEPAPEPPLGRLSIGRVGLFQGLLKALQRQAPTRAVAAPLVQGAALKTVRQEGVIRAERQIADREDRGTQLNAMSQRRSVELEERERWRPGPDVDYAAERLGFSSISEVDRGPLRILDGMAPYNETGALSGDRAHPQEAIALVERIQAFVRSGRPALELTLNGGAWAGRVAIERSGPSSVAIRMRTEQNVSRPETLQALEQAMGAAGLRLSALELA